MGRAALAVVAFAIIAAPACTPRVRCDADPDPVGGGRARRPVHAHSHNDYLRRRPLADALARGFTSVEADLWLAEGVVMVGHERDALVGSLAALYLDPLQAAVDRRGSVHGDGEVFHLWLDLKERGRPLRRALHALFLRYDMLTEWAAGEVRAGPVVAILTGDEASKAAFLREWAPRRAVRDAGVLRADDPPADGAWRYYSLRWPDWIDWDGQGEPPPAEATRLRCLVRTAHAKGRGIRFWKAPETPAFWSLARDLGVDFVGTDDPDALGAVLGGGAARGVEASAAGR